MTNACPLCGAAVLEEREGEFQMEAPPGVQGGKMIVPNAAWSECPNCHERFLPPPLIEALDALRYARLGLLRPEAILAVRVRAGLSQTEMASFVGVGEKTYARWESGRSIQNKSSDNLIRLADQFPGLFPQLEAQRDPHRQDRIADYLKSLGEHKGANELALAAHGAEIDSALAEELRCRLRLLARSRKHET